jgi:hypothetical protein
MEIDDAGWVAQLAAERVKDLQIAAERHAVEAQLSSLSEGSLGGLWPIGIA